MLPPIHLFFKEKRLFSWDHFSRVFPRLLIPFLLLIGRFWLAQSFGKEAMGKITHWQATINLFNYEYEVPFFSTEVAAYGITLIELGGAFCLLVGYKMRQTCGVLLGLLAFLQLTNLDTGAHGFQALCLLTLLSYRSARGFFLRIHVKSPSLKVRKTSDSLEF